MEKPKLISELLRGAGRLGSLDQQLRTRSVILDQVRAALPRRLAEAVVSAGVKEGCLTIGVVSAVWASRIRYFSEATRLAVSSQVGTRLTVVRVRVLPSQGV